MVFSIFKLYDEINNKKENLANILIWCLQEVLFEYIQVVRDFERK
jgi:hypothetical protein